MSYRRSDFGLCVLVLTLGGASSGCILPIPHVLTTWGGIRGSVVDAADARPIAGAMVEALYGDRGRREVTTAPDGTFSLPIKRRFCWGIQVGVALNHSLPYNTCNMPRYVLLDVSAPGYRPLHLALPAERVDVPTDPPPRGWPEMATDEAGNWRLPPIGLATTYVDDCSPRSGPR